MERMAQFSWLFPSILAVGALGGLMVQHRHIARLEARVSAPSESPDDTAAELATLTARVAQLERSRARAIALPTAPPAAAPAAGGPPPVVPGNLVAEVQQLRQDVDALLTGEATSTEQGQARLRSLIADTQQRQWAEREERRDARIVQQLADDAHLSQAQRDDLGRAFEAERTQRRALLAGVRQGEGRSEELRSSLQALRAQTDQKARALLSADQYTKYEATRTQGRGPRGGGGGGGGQPAPTP